MQMLNQKQDSYEFITMMDLEDIMNGSYESNKNSFFIGENKQSIGLKLWH